jgi:hypothetical protein
VAKLHKLDRHDRNVMPAIDVVDMATRGGARALHMADRIGSLEPGKLADLIVLDGDATAMVPLYEVYSALVYAASPKDVRSTIIHGRGDGGSESDHGGRERGEGKNAGDRPARERRGRQTHRLTSVVTRGTQLW